MDYGLIPVAVAHAQTFGTIINQITSLLNRVIPILFLIATIVFFWGIILYITSGGDEEKRTEGRQYIIYGLIGLFVMIAVWGIVNVLIGFFFPGGLGPTPGVPDIPGSTGAGTTFDPCSGNLGGVGCE